MIDSLYLIKSLVLLGVATKIGFSFMKPGWIYKSESPPLAFAIDLFNYVLLRAIRLFVVLTVIFVLLGLYYYQLQIEFLEAAIRSTQISIAIDEVPDLRRPIVLKSIIMSLMLLWGATVATAIIAVIRMTKRGGRWKAVIERIGKVARFYFPILLVAVYFSLPLNSFNATPYYATEFTIILDLAIVILGAWAALSALGICPQYQIWYVNTMVVLVLLVTCNLIAINEDSQRHSSFLKEQTELFENGRESIKASQEFVLFTSLTAIGNMVSPIVRDVSTSPKRMVNEGFENDTGWLHYSAIRITSSKLLYRVYDEI